MFQVNWFKHRVKITNDSSCPYTSGAGGTCGVASRGHNGGHRVLFLWWGKNFDGPRHEIVETIWFIGWRAVMNLDVDFLSSGHNFPRCEENHFCSRVMKKLISYVDTSRNLLLGIIKNLTLI